MTPSEYWHKRSAADMGVSGSAPRDDTHNRDSEPHSCGQCECCEAWRNKVQILTALLPTCGTCRHYDPDHGTLDGVPYGFCESPVSWFRSHGTRPMPPHEGCTTWAARDEDDDALFIAGAVTGESGGLPPLREARDEDDGA